MSRHKGSFFQRKLLDSSTFFPSLVSWVSFVVSITGQLGCQTPACYFIFTHVPSCLLQLIGSITRFPSLCVVFFTKILTVNVGFVKPLLYVSFQTSCWNLLLFSSSTLSAPAWQKSTEVVTAPSLTLRPSSLCHPACLLLPLPCPSLHASHASPLAL